MVRLTGQLADRGHHVVLITLSGESSDFHRPAPNVRRLALDVMSDSPGLLSALSANLRRLWKVRSTVLEQTPDVVLVFGDATNLLALLALAGSRVPVVVSERIDPRHYPIGRIRTVIRPSIYKWLAASLVVQTRSVAQWALEFLPQRKVWVIPNAVTPDMTAELDQSDPLPPDFPQITHKTVVAMGRLDRQKGFDLLLEAWAKVHQSAPEWNLVILGEGAERKNLEQQARNCDRVFLPGKVRHPNRVLRRAGAFVLSSRFEGFPNALLEAMAAGLPCLSTDCPSGPADIIQHEQNGLLAPPDNADALATALQRLLTDAPLRERLAPAGRESLAQFAPEVILPLWEACLRGKSPLP